MNFLRSVYIFFNEHVTWDFGAKINEELSVIWRAIGAWIFS